MQWWKVLLPIFCLLFAGASSPAAAQAAKGATLGPAETLSGKIAIVDTAQKLLVVEGARGVTYSFVLRAGTRITSGGQRVKLDELPAHKGKQASVKFVPTRRGNLAQTVEITG